MENDEEFSGVVQVKKMSDFSVKKTGAAKKKKKSIPEPFFKACCIIWIEVYGMVVPPPPGEKIADPKIWKDKVEMRHLKYILKDLRERAEEQKVLWDEVNAKIRFRAFIERAGKDDFISKNFLLRIINNNKTKIFNNQITPKKYVGKNNTEGIANPERVGPKTRDDFGRLGRR